MEPEILAIEKDRLADMLQSPLLATYRHLLEDTDRMRAYTKDEQTETMLAMLADAAGSSSECFDMLESVDMTFPEITDEKGERVTLTHGNFGVYRESGDQRVRREAFEAYFGEFKKFINTFAAMYAGNVKMDNYFTRVRGYASTCERAHFSRTTYRSAYTIS